MTMVPYWCYDCYSRFMYMPLLNIIWFETTISGTSAIITTVFMPIYQNGCAAVGYIRLHDDDIPWWPFPHYWFLRYHYVLWIHRTILAHGNSSVPEPTSLRMITSRIFCYFLCWKHHSWHEHPFPVLALCEGNPPANFRSLGQGK